MSYCDFNNAFKNMDHKILETFDGITSEDLSFNLVSSEEESIQNHPAKNSILSDISNNGKNLNGTSIHRLNNINQNNINQNLQYTNKYNSCNSNKNINLNNNKLTHRECIHLYLNPLNNKNPNYELAHRHIIICSLCQNEINKKVQESFQTVNTQVNPINVVDRTTTIQDVKAANKSITNQSNDNAESKVLSLSMRDLEVLLKNITERTSNDKTEHFSRIIQKLDDNERNKPFCIELNFLNIAVCLLIILLLIDIVLRLKK